MGLYQKLENVNKKLLFMLAFFIGVFHILNIAGIVAMSAMTVRVVHLMVMMAIAFLAFPAYSKKPATEVLRLIFFVLTFVTGFYILKRWEGIINSGGLTNSLDTVMGLIMVLVVLEATRRSIGKALMIIALLFVMYPFIGQYLPGILQSRAYDVERVFSWLFTTTQAIYGIPISVSASYIILFCIYGAFLNEFGVGDFFFKVSSSLTSGLIAGTAKTAIVFSALVGMISGSAAGNVAVTGSLTIPMMKKNGYRPETAASVEAIASTGGQIMPPIMGASAFLMAEMIGIPYSHIMKAAVLPAILYFLTIYIIVHLTALRRNIDFGETEGETVSFLETLKEGWYFVIPIAGLIALLISGYSPFKAAYYSLVAMLVVYTVAKRDFSLSFLKRIIEAIVKGARDAGSIAIACGAAGIIVGIITLTGIGSKLSSLIVVFSYGKLLLALLLTMLASIVLGMGLPTTAAYLVLATVVAPALEQMGLPILTAHLFVFFFGCISTITPPVAMASYVAAGIAGANATKVGWTAFKFGLVSFILPFMFAFSPSLLLEGPLLVVLQTVVLSIIGVAAIACSIVGFYKIVLPKIFRAALLVGGILMVNQGIYTDIAGIAILLLVFLSIINKHKKSLEVTKGGAEINE